LHKLQQTKSVDGKATLLDYVVSAVIQRNIAAMQALQATQGTTPGFTPEAAAATDSLKPAGGVAGALATQEDVHFVGQFDEVFQPVKAAAARTSPHSHYCPLALPPVCL
jgi:hypothetical protein